ncbi:MAG: universal stress protein UspA-like protein [Frankiales bacterium]|nr:universal stress protein UspA-like protein [Frankiales bacterium]
MRTVVSGVDSEQQSRQVLRKALAEAQSAGRPLEALHAWSTPTWASGAVGLDDTEGVQTGRQEAQQLAAHLLADALHTRVGELPVRASARGAFGDAGDLLVRASSEAGLVVVGSRSHGPLLSAVLGSATAHVLHYAPCPVMVVPRSVAPGPYRRVVVGYDDQEHAGSALRWALDAARRHHCPLVVLHALRLTPSPVRLSAQVTDAHREDEVHTWLAAQVTRASRRFTDVPVSLSVRDGSPLDVLLGEAGADDLLVLGSRARSGLAEVLLGAVAVQCAKQATGTVVVVRAGQERLDDPAPDAGHVDRDDQLVRG